MILSLMLTNQGSVSSNGMTTKFSGKCHLIVEQLQLQMSRGGVRKKKLLLLKGLL